MDKIYKYPLYLTTEVQSVTLPEGAEIVHFAMQGDTPFIWVRVKPYGTVQQIRQFCIRGTGHDIQDNLKHVGTVLHGLLVWHLFELEQ